MRLLLVEDNDELSKLLVKSLRSAGFDADIVTTAAEALGVLRSSPYSAVILDLGLPDDDGLVVLRTLRNEQGTTPVIVLTAREGVRDRVAGLAAGADDYLVKPFAIEELLARLEAILRRPGQLLGRSLTLGNLVFDSVSRQLFINGASQTLPARELADSGPAVGQRAPEHRRIDRPQRSYHDGLDLFDMLGQQEGCENRSHREGRDQGAGQSISIGPRHRAKDLAFDALHGEQRNECCDRNGCREEDRFVDLKSADENEPKPVGPVLDGREPAGACRIG